MLDQNAMTLAQRDLLAGASASNAALASLHSRVLYDPTKYLFDPPVDTERRTIYQNLYR